MGSSPKKHLIEIAEEEEDEVPPTKRKSVVAEPPQTPKSPKWNAEPVTLNAELAASPEQSKFAAPSTSEVPTFVGAAESRPDTGDSYSAADAAAAQDFGYTGYAFSKPKVKLAPRPSVEAATRPQTAGNFRPVSAIPAGYKLFGKGRRTKSKDSNTTISPQEEVAEFVPSPTDETERPVSSSSTVGPEGAIKKISPEKARLMKAMKLREKKKAAAAAAVAAQGEAETEDAETDAVVDAEVETETETAATAAADEMESPTATTDSIHVADAMSSSTHTEVSEVASEPDQSTNASSVSESTDETARAKDELAEEQDGNVEAVAPAVVDPVAQPEAAKEASEEDKAEEQKPIALPVSKFSSSIGSAAESEAVATSPEAENKAAADPAALVASPEAILAATMAAAEPVVSTPIAELAKSPLMLSSEIPEPKEAAEKDAKAVVPTETATAEVEKPADATESKTEAQEPAAEPEAKAVEPMEKATEGDAETVAAEQQQEQKKSAVVEPIQTESIATLEPAADIKSSSPTEAPETRAEGAPEATSYNVRTVSDPVRGKFVSDNDISKSSARSLTTGAAYLHKITQQQQNNNLSLKSAVGSSISQRIKALEKLSSVTEGEARPASRDRPQTTFFSVKKKELKAPSVLERANSLRATTPSPGDSPETKRPLLDRTNMSNRLSVFQPFMDPVSPGKETISVTAKIVRDPMPSTEGLNSNPAAFNPLELKESPLMVSHQKVAQDKTSPPETPLEQSGSQESLKEGRSRRTSLSIVRGLMKDKKSPTSGSEEFQAPGSPSQRPAMSTNSSFSARSPSSENVNAGDDKSPDGKMSRAGRFMKRLSTLSGGSRSKTSGPTTTPLAPAAEEAAGGPQQGQQQIVSYLGDVNVQFPDSLLWKRRNLCLDDKGFLVMSALPSQSSRAAQGTKRFHMSEFRAPYIPEVEMQELPNSVVVDFVEGTSLQLACEDRHGQMEVLSSESCLRMTNRMNIC